MFLNTILAMFLANMKFNLFSSWVGPLFNSIGTIFKMGLMGIIAGFFKVGEAIYAVFESLAMATDIFDKDMFGRIANNIYGIFGVVVLFIAAYNFLMYVVDPEKNSGDMSIEKMLKNVAKVFIIIVLLPTIFSLANGLIGSIVEQHVIEDLIFGGLTEEDDCEKVYSSIPGANPAKLRERNEGNRMGKAMTTIFASFFTYENNTPENIWLDTEDKVFFPSYKCWNGQSSCNLAGAIEAARCTGKYSYLVNFGANWAIHSDQFKFEFFLGLLSICYIIYVLVSFCFDLAVRAVKLAFYQIVAPLCVGCAILPGPKKEIYTKWRSLTIKTYTSVLIRVFAMSLGVLFISSVDSLMRNIANSYSSRCDGFCQMLVQLFLILGLLTFVKQMPKLIDELLGEESGLGSTVKDKLKEAAQGAAKLAAPAFGAHAAASSVRKGWANGRAQRKAELEQKKKELQEAQRNARLNPSEANKEALDKAKSAYNAVKKDRKGMLASLATGAATSMGALGRSLSRSTGVSDALSEIGKLHKDALLNAEGAVRDASNTTTNAKDKLLDIKDWLKNLHQVSEDREVYDAARDAFEDIEEKIKNATGQIKIQINDKQSEVAAQQDRLNKIKGQKESIKQRIKAAQDEETECADKISELRRDLRKNGRNYSAETRQQIQDRIDELDTQRGQALSAQNAAIRDMNDFDRVHTPQKIAAEEVKLQQLQSSLASLESQLSREEAALKVSLNFDDAKKQFEAAAASLSASMQVCHDSNVIINTINHYKQVATGVGGEAALTRDKNVCKCLEESRNGAYGSIDDMVKKTDGFVEPDISEALKVFGNDDTANLVTALSTKFKKKDQFASALRTLNNSNTTTEFISSLQRLGMGKIDAKTAESIRSILQNKYDAFVDKERKTEDGRIAEALLKYQRTGEVDQYISGIIGKMAPGGKQSPELVEAISKSRDYLETLKVYDPDKFDIKLSGTYDPDHSLAKIANESIDGLRTSISTAENKNSVLAARKKMREAMNSNPSDSSKK